MKNGSQPTNHCLKPPTRLVEPPTRLVNDGRKTLSTWNWAPSPGHHRSGSSECGENLEVVLSMLKPCQLCATSFPCRNNKLVETGATTSWQVTGETGRNQHTYCGATNPSYNKLVGSPAGYLRKTCWSTHQPFVNTSRWNQPNPLFRIALSLILWVSNGKNCDNDYQWHQGVWHRIRVEASTPWSRNSCEFELSRTLWTRQVIMFMVEYKVENGWCYFGMHLPSNLQTCERNSFSVTDNFARVPKICFRYP